MADLLKDYFERDLTEAEEQRLADEIAASPKQSLRFAELAHRAYRQTGLPDLGGSAGGEDDRRLLAAVILKLFFLLGVVGLTLYGLWRLYSHLPSPSVSLPPPVLDQPVSPKPRAKAAKPVRVVTETQPAVTKPAVTQAVAPPAAVPPVIVPAAKADNPLPLPVLALAKPGMVQPTAYDSTKQYEGMDVMVEQKKPGVLTVRVLDSGKNEVRLLFAGMVAPGKWDFMWDGKLESGKIGQPGTYQVEVRLGKQVLTKEITLPGEAVTSQK